MAHLLTPLPTLQDVTRRTEAGTGAVFPPCLETTVALCMEKAPEARFGTAAAVDDALDFCEQVLAGNLPFDTPLPSVLMPGAPAFDGATPFEEDSLDLARIEPVHPTAPAARPLMAALTFAAMLGAGIGLGLLFA
jgi:hypothetical protein